MNFPNFSDSSGVFSFPEFLNISKSLHPLDVQGFVRALTIRLPLNTLYLILIIYDLFLFNVTNRMPLEICDILVRNRGSLEVY